MAHESQNTKSIFDFLYLDTGKIKSFYAQLTGNGALTSLKQTNHLADGRNFEASAGIPLTTSGKGGTSHLASQGSETQYDATPTMPREMINRLDELGFIYRDLNESMLGNLVLYKGTLGVVDIAGTKDLVEPTLNIFISEQLQGGNAAQKKEAQELKKSLKDIVQVVKVLPFALEARLLVNSGKEDDSGIPLLDEVWMTLSREEMVGSTHDLNFKHGSYLAGEWFVIGVLDATPFDGFNISESESGMRQGVHALTSMMKNQFGRPESAYGLTPIAIFRVIKPKTQEV
ncbi:hypothetical protein FK216_15610 [Moraxellaceae bacterium AER2_44_116]|nr:hypothetical protein FK216_15610 [Moraxellaceae bacterium AER2_44_116]